MKLKIVKEKLKNIYIQFEINENICFYVIHLNKYLLKFFVVVLLYI